MLIRYQLKQSRPVDRRASSVVGSIISHFESSKSTPPACGVKSYVLIGLPVGCLSGPAALKSTSNDFRVAVTPLTFDKIDTFFCREINYGVWLSRWRVGICFRKCAPGQENQRAEGKLRRKRKRHIEALMGASRCASIEFRRPA